MPKKRTPSKQTHPLVGKWFHSYHAPDRPDVIEWQGTILAEVAPGQFLVQLYEWFVGAPTTQRIVAVTAMATWTFYNSHDEMNDAYADYSVRRRHMFDADHPVALKDV